MVAPPTLDEQNIGITLAERTADVIGKRILARTPGYGPGARLYPKVLAEDLGVSNTPVRQALQLLAADGLVILAPRRGVRVVSLTFEEIHDFVSVRAGLEAVALHFRGGRFSLQEIAGLHEYLDVCEKAIGDEDLAAYRANDDMFHSMIVINSHSPRLLSLYETMLKQTHLLQLYYSHQWDTMRIALAEHRALAQQFGEGDPARSEEAIWAHWERTKARLNRVPDAFVQLDAEDE